MKQIKLYIIGSVSTKGCFAYSQENIHQDLYEVTGMQYQSSFISLMSNQLRLKDLNIENLDSWSKKVIMRDMNKTFLQEIIQLEPDYIIIDLISEIESSVMKIQDTYITKIKGKSNKLDFDNYEAEEISLKKHKELYIELLKNKIYEFRKFCSENLPNTKIIFHVAPFLYSYISRDRQTKCFENKGLIFQNKLLKEVYYDHCVTKDDLIIDLNDKTYFSTENHKLSLNPLHL